MAFHFTVFSFATVIHSMMTNRSLSSSEAWAYAPILILFYSGEYSLLHRLSPALAPWISLAFAGFLIALYFISKRTLEARSLESSNLIVAFASVVLFHSLYLEILTDDIRPWLLPVILISAAFVGVRTSKGNAIPFLAVTVVAISEYVQISFGLMSHSEKPLLAASAIVSVGAAFLYFSRRKSEMANPSIGPVLLAFAHGLAAIALYNLLNSNGSLAVSGSWLTYAVIIVGAGFKLHEKVLAKSSLMILGLAAGKALLYDASAADTQIRIVCLLLTGAVLYGCGLLLRKIDSWREVEALN